MVLSMPRFVGFLALLRWFCVLLCHILVTQASNVVLTDKRVTETADAALMAINSRNFQLGEQYLLQGLNYDNNDLKLNSLLGYVYVSTGELDKGLRQMERALTISEWKQDHVIANYVETLRKANRVYEASEICSLYVNQVDILSRSLPLNCAVISKVLNDADRALDYYQRAIQAEPENVNTWYELILFLIHPLGRFEVAQEHIQKLIARQAATAEIYGLRGDLYFLYLHDLDKAADAYSHAMSLNADFYKGKKGLAAVLQLSGQLNRAGEVYASMQPFPETDDGIRNNYAAYFSLRGMFPEQEYWLLESIRVNPLSVLALTNLAQFYEAQGNYSQATHYYRRAVDSSQQQQQKISCSLQIQSRMVMPAVPQNWTHAVATRNKVESELFTLLTQWNDDPTSISAQESLDDSYFETIHFYIVYLGVNDKRFQQLMQQLYKHCVNGVDTVHVRSPELSSLEALRSRFIDSPFQPRSTTQDLHVLTRKVRIGFVSKYFNVYEPHGLLLEGVIKSLPRNQFTVCVGVVIGADAAASTDGRDLLLPTLRQHADEIVQIPLRASAAVRVLADMALDVVVFADTLTEPTTHFLSMARVAPIQIAFWGSPVTSSSSHVDYFISGDDLEHPYRTRMDDATEPYNEQVILLGGQGIYYAKPTVSTLLAPADHEGDSGLDIFKFSRTQFGITDSSEPSFLFFCPQSVFKIHPLFDQVFVRILQRTPSNVHIVVMSGRKQSWTDTYMHRLNQSLGDFMALPSKRFHFIPRVSSEQFQSLLTLADAVLHPFPFDGSRVCADALVVGIPYITMPTEYLRGRMGKAYLRTMNIPQLVAHSIDEYVDIAVELAFNKALYGQMKALIAERSYLVWEDVDYLYSWYEFLFRTAVGSGNSTPSRVYSWEVFVESYAKNSGSTVTEEKMKRNIRERNRKAFDAVYRHERHLLDSRSHKAVLESKFEGDGSTEQMQIPRVFNNWQPTSASWSPVEVKASSASIYLGAANNERSSVSVQALYESSPRRVFAELKERASPHSLINRGRGSLLPRRQYGTLGTGAVPVPVGGVVGGMEQQPRTLSNTVDLGSVATKSSLHQYQGTSLATTTPSSPILLASSVGADLQQRVKNVTPPSRWIAPALTPRLREVLTKLRSFIRAAVPQFEAGFELMKPLEHEFKDEMLFHLEYGNLQYYRGQYESAYHHCCIAVEMCRKQGSIHAADEHIPEKCEIAMAHACVGVSAVYLQLPDVAIASLLTAQQLTRKHRDTLEPNDDYHEPRSSIFGIDEDAIIFNVISTYSAYNRSEECVLYAMESMHLPSFWSPTRHGTKPPLNGLDSIDDISAALVLTLANVNWTQPQSKQAIQQLERYYKRSGQILDPDFDLLATIQRVQGKYDALMTSAVTCLRGVNLFLPQLIDDLVQLTVPAKDESWKAYWEIFMSSAASVDEATGSRSSIRKQYARSGIALITQHYQSASVSTTPSSWPSPAQIFEEALQQNLNNPAISEVFLLNDVGTGSHERDYAHLKNAWKITVHVIGKRLTFLEAFVFANQFLQGRTVIIANADMYFDSSLYILRNFVIGGSKHAHTVLALNKHTTNLHGEVDLMIRCDSQDAWIFRSPLTPPQTYTLDPALAAVIESAQIVAANVPTVPQDKPFPILTHSNFFMGSKRCDNVLAYLFHISGYQILNPAFAIHAIEAHSYVAYTARALEDSFLYKTSEQAHGQGKNICVMDELGL